MTLIAQLSDIVADFIYSSSIVDITCRINVFTVCQNPTKKKSDKLNNNICYLGEVNIGYFLFILIQFLSTLIRQRTPIRFYLKVILILISANFRLHFQIPCFGDPSSWNPDIKKNP